jgi:hypothetical protein
MTKSTPYVWRLEASSGPVYRCKVDFPLGDPRPVMRDAWEVPPTRRQAACVAGLMALQQVTKGNLYLWTFTLCKTVGHHEAVSTMTLFWGRVQRRLGACSSVRVAEEHESGLLHFHIVCNRRYPAKLVWRLAGQSGIGHLDVATVKKGETRQLLYVAKYLGKGAPLDGVQRYSRGGMTFGAVRGMECRSPEADLIRAVMRAERLPGGTLRRGAWQKGKRAVDAFRHAG